MPNQVVRRLSTLYADGMSVYPRGMRGLAASAPRRGVLVKPAAGAKFLEWVRATHPKLYAAAERRASARNGLGQVDKKAEAVGPLDRIVNTITELAPTYLQYRAQKEIFDAQMDRLSRGLPPIEDVGAYAPTMRFGVDPAAAEAVKPFLLWGGLGLAALFVVSQLSRRRR